MNKSKLGIYMLIIIIVTLIGSVLFFQKFYKVDLKKIPEITSETYSPIRIKQLVLPEMYTYIASETSDINVEYSTDKNIEIVFDSEIDNTDDVIVSLLQTGSYVHLKKEDDEKEIYRTDHLYEISQNRIRIIPNDYHETLPGGFLKININNINSQNMSLYCTTTTFNNITLLKGKLNYTNYENPSMILPKTNIGNKKVAYVTEDTKLLDESGNIICNLYIGDNVEIIEENTGLCSIYYPNFENINTIKTINKNTDIYDSQYVNKVSGYIEEKKFKIIPSPKNEHNIVEVYIDSTGFDAIPVILVSSPFCGCKYEEITKSKDITSDFVSKLEDELLIQNKVFMLPTSYWGGYTINGEKIENLDPRSQQYIMNLSNDEYKYIRNSIIEYYDFLEEKWKNIMVSSEYLSQKEFTLARAKRYIDFELCFLDWVTIDRMNDLNKFADRVYEKIGTPETKERIYYLLSNLDKDYSNNMMEFTNEFLVNFNKIVKVTQEIEIDNIHNIMEINSKCLLAKDYKNFNVLEEEADIIIIAELEENEGCTNYNEKAKEYMMIHTLGTLKINKVFKGNVKENDIIPFINGGGTISYLEYEKGLYPAQKEKSGNIFQTFSKKEKEEFLVKQRIGNNIEIEKGKQYLIFLRFDEQFDRYATVGLGYGIREYDEASNTFFNNNTGEYEDFNIEENIRERTKNIIDMRTSFSFTKDLKDINVLAEETDLIVLAEVEKINGVTNYCEKIDEYTMVFTLENLKINQIIKGDIDIPNNIPFKTPGGLISIFEYEKGLEEAQKNKKDSIYTIYTEDEKKNIFLDVQYGNSIELEKGKEYLLFLNYSDNFEMYSVIGLGYGARELDRSTMKIKNNDTKIFENCDFKKLTVK